MPTQTRSKNNTVRWEELEKKAAILDDLVEFIEEKYFGFLLKDTENEKNISLAKAKELLS